MKQKIETIMKISTNEPQTAAMITIVFPEPESITSVDDNDNINVDVPVKPAVAVNPVLCDIAHVFANSLEFDPVGVSVSDRIGVIELE
jgi:hypothetical protein